MARRSRLPGVLVDAVHEFLFVRGQRARGEHCVVPDDQLDAEIAERSPAAITIATRSFNADTENFRAIGSLGFSGTALYYATDEAKEGGAAQRE